MTSISNSAEGGTHGTTVTTGNSGGASGTACSLVTVGTGNTITFSTAGASHGSMGYAASFGTSTNGFLVWPFVTSGRLVMRFYFKLDTLPSALDHLSYFRGSGNMGGLGITSTNKLRLIDASANLISGSTATNALSAGVWYRAEVAVTKGTTTSNGRLEYAYYLGDSTTAEFSYDSGTTVNTDIADTATARLGRQSSTTVANLRYYDSFAADALASGWIGPVSNTGATGDLSGSGTLSATDVLSFTASSALSGSGTLSADGTVLTSVGLSGSGTLTAVGTGGDIVITAGLSGSGTLTGTQTSMSASPAAALSGSGTLSASGTQPTPTPGQVLNIGSGAGKNHFYVQTAPTGGSSWVAHTQAEIEAGYTEDPYFKTVGTSAPYRVQFWARMDAPQTSGSSYSRSELREVDENGVNYKFDALSGTHEMHGRTRITHLPPTKPELVIAQLHNGDADRIAIRTQVISGQTKLLVRINGNAVLPRFAEPYVLGTEFEWKIRLVGGVAYIYYNDMTTPIIESSALVQTSNPAGWYFKTGAYNQSNETIDSATEWGSAELRDLSVSHSNIPEPAPTPATVLNIGYEPNQNHFLVQTAPTGGSAIVSRSQDEIINGYSEDPYFKTVGTQSPFRVQLWARMDAPSTSGSSFSRSELREVDQTGANFKFDALTGTHELHGRTKITHLPPNKPEIVIAQLHNGDFDRVAIRTQVISAQTKLLVRINGSAVTPRFAEPYVLGTEFEWKIRLVNGTVYVYYNDMTTPLITSTALVQTTHPDGWYWKAGAYNQSNETIDSPTEWGSVELRDLAASHLYPDKVFFGSQGIFSAAGEQTMTPGVLLTGSGTLTAAASMGASASADLAGSGTLTSAAVPGQLAPADLSGSGTLAATAIQGSAASAPLSGTGTLSGTAVASSGGTAVLSGSGTLTLATVPSAVGSVALSGSGTLTVSSSLVVEVLLDLSGDGTFAGLVGRWSPASLSGGGTLVVSLKHLHVKGELGARRWSGELAANR